MKPHRWRLKLRAGRMHQTITWRCARCAAEAYTFQSESDRKKPRPPKGEALRRQVPEDCHQSTVEKVHDL